RHLIRVRRLMSVLSMVRQPSGGICMACPHWSVRLPPQCYWRASRHCADTLILRGVSPVYLRVFPSGSGEVRWRFVQQGFSLAAYARKTPVKSTHIVESFFLRQYVE